MDKKMLMAFYGSAQRYKTLGRVVNVLYKYSSFAFSVIYYAAGLYLILNDRKALVLYVTVPFVQLLANLALRKLIKRKRPYLTLGLKPPKNKERNLITGEDSFSFPSNHSSSAGIIAFACMFVNTGAAAAVFFLAILTGLSRVCAGVHYPSDVLAGFILSALFAIVGFNLLPALLMA